MWNSNLSGNGVTKLQSKNVHLSSVCDEERLLEAPPPPVRLVDDCVDEIRPRVAEFDVRAFEKQVKENN